MTSAWRRPDGSEIEISEVKNVFHDAYAKIVAGEMEDDGFNRLVLLRPSRLARDQRAARLCQISAPGRHRLQPDLYGGGARPQCAARAPAGAAVPRLVQPRQAGDRRRAGPDQRAGDREGARCGHQPRRGPHPAALPQPDPIDAQDQFLPARQGLHLLQARFPCAGGAAAAAPAGGDLGLFAAGRGGASARRQGGARRHPLVRPARGFPHRGAEPDEGPDGEERRHRARRLQGRLRGQASAGRRAGARRSRPR